MFSLTTLFRQHSRDIVPDFSLQRCLVGTRPMLVLEGVVNYQKSGGGGGGREGSLSGRGFLLMWPGKLA